MAADSEAASASDLTQPQFRFGAIKRTLMRLGSLCSARVLERCETPLNYLWLGHWMNQHGFALREHKRVREDLFEDLARKVGSRRVLYLEFGVAQGASLRQWSQLLTNPASHLDGFDTFEGLPFDW